MKEGMSRIFLALGLPEATKAKIKIVQEEIANFLNDCCYTKIENLHLTVAFLGNLTVARIQDLELISEEVSQKVPTFKITIQGIGVFPEIRRAKILWLGVQKQRILQGFNQLLYRYLSKAGFKLDSRPYHPHVTIARAHKHPFKKEIVALLQNKFRNIEIGSFCCQKFSIFSSLQNPSGELEYHKVKEIELKGKDVS